LTPAPAKPTLPAPEPTPPAATKPAPQQPSPVKPQTPPASPPAAKPKPEAEPAPANGGGGSKSSGNSNQSTPNQAGGGQSTQPSGPGNAKSAPDTAHPAAAPAPGSGSGPSGQPGNGGGRTPGAPAIPAPEGRTAPDFGAPALPAGPGDGELNILDKYGDHCMAEIKKQARNPERAREKWHDAEGTWGTVTFEFEVSSKGKLLDVKIVNDGGFAPLGEEVAEATRVAAQYFGPWSKYGTVAAVSSWTFRRKLKFPLY
jgi:outer membrane biosynthesis protein TonB